MGRAVSTDAISQQEKLNRLKTYLQHTPDNQPLLRDTIACALDAGEWTLAKDLLHRAKAMFPDETLFIGQDGILAMATGDFHRAVAIFNSMIDLGEEESAIYYNLAYSLSKVGAHEAALQHINKVDSDTLYNQKLLLIGRAYYHLERFEAGIEAISPLLESTNRSAEALGLAALLHCDNNNLNTSLKYAEEAIDLDDKNYEALVARATCLVITRHYDDALRDYLKLRQLYGDVGRVLSGIGQIHFHRFEFTEAKTTLHQAVALMDNHIGTWHLLGWAELILKEYESALKSFERAYELDRTFAETHGCFASLYALTGEVAKAEKHIKLAHRLDPTSNGQHYARMVLLQKSGQGAEAQRLFDRVMNTENSVFGDSLGNLVRDRLNELNLEQVTDNEVKGQD